MKNLYIYIYNPYLFALYISTASVVSIAYLTEPNLGLSNSVAYFNAFLEKHMAITILNYVLVIALFLAPIVLKLFLRQKNEYFFEKGLFERSIIRDHYQEFKNNYEKIHNSFNNFPLIYGENYVDPPFNTEKMCFEMLACNKSI